MTQEQFLAAAAASGGAETLAAEVWAEMMGRDDAKLSEKQWDAYFRPHLQCHRQRGFVRAAAIKGQPWCFRIRS